MESEALEIGGFSPLSDEIFYCPAAFLEIQRRVRRRRSDYASAEDKKEWKDDRIS